MRVISGSARGHKLNCIKGKDTRPTADKTKESLFSMISNSIPGSNVLDIFAGTGALGIECLSRGAASCIFADKSPQAAKIIQQNLEHTKLRERGQIYITGWEACINKISGSKLDIIFLDPPYKKDFIPRVIDSIMKKQLLSASGIIVIECEEAFKLTSPELTGLQIIKSKEYRNTNIYILKQCCTHTPSVAQQHNTSSKVSAQ